MSTNNRAQSEAIAAVNHAVDHVIAHHPSNAELQQTMLRLTHAVNNLLQSGIIVRAEAQETRKASAKIVQAPPTPAPKVRVLALLATANAGKPGHLTTVQVQERLGLTKSEVWHAYAGKKGLVNDGDVVVMRGKTDPETGRRGPDVLFHCDAIVTV